MTTWTQQQKFVGQTPIAYNSNFTYNQASYIYIGLKGTVWQEQTKS